MRDGTQTSVCLNCGVTLRATKDNKGLEISNPTPTDFGGGASSGSGMGGDFFSNWNVGEKADNFNSGNSKGDTKKNQRETKIIDLDAVEVKDDE